MNCVLCHALVENWREIDSTIVHDSQIVGCCGNCSTRLASSASYSVNKMAPTKEDAPAKKNVYVPTGKPRGRAPGQKSKKKMWAEKMMAIRGVTKKEKKL